MRALISAKRIGFLSAKPLGSSALDRLRCAKYLFRQTMSFLTKGLSLLTDSKSFCSSANSGFRGSLQANRRMRCLATAPENLVHRKNVDSLGSSQGSS